VTVTFKNTYSILNTTSTTSTLEYGSTIATTIIVIIRKTVSILTLNTVRIISALEAGSTINTEGLNNYIIIAIINIYGKYLSLFFISNTGGPSLIGNPFIIILPNNIFTQYIFLTGWAGRIYIGPNFNLYNSKIKGSYTGPFNIDINYINNYSVPITYSS